MKRTIERMEEARKVMMTWRPACGILSSVGATRLERSLDLCDEGQAGAASAARQWIVRQCHHVTSTSKALGVHRHRRPRLHFAALLVAPGTGIPRAPRAFRWSFPIDSRFGIPHGSIPIFRCRTTHSPTQGVVLLSPADPHDKTAGVSSRYNVNELEFNSLYTQAIRGDTNAYYAG